jgi:hypothetical protein
LATLTARSPSATQTDDWRTKALAIRKIWVEATNDRQGAIRAADLGAGLPRTAGTTGLIGSTSRAVATGEAK